MTFLRKLQKPFGTMLNNTGTVSLRLPRQLRGVSCADQTSKTFERWLEHTSETEYEMEGDDQDARENERDGILDSKHSPKWEQSKLVDFIHLATEVT